MRIKFPQILCYEDWLDLFKMGFVGDDEFDENGVRRFKKKNDIPWAEDPETAEMKMVRDDKITTMEKNKAVMLELEQKMVKYQQLYTLENPSVYLATIKDSRTLSTAIPFFSKLGFESISSSLAVICLISILLCPRRGWPSG